MEMTECLAKGYNERSHTSCIEPRSSWPYIEQCGKKWYMRMTSVAEHLLFLVAAFGIRVFTKRAQTEDMI